MSSNGEVKRNTETELSQKEKLAVPVKELSETEAVKVDADSKVNGSGSSKAVNGHKFSQPADSNHESYKEDGLTQHPSLTGTQPRRTPSPKGKSQTLKQEPHMGTFKRLIVCCDGTWQDGIEKKYRWQYSNILKLARAFHREDQRHDPPIHQIVFYQAGVGTDDSIYSHVVGGATGAGLAEKVQDAYAFIAHNYMPGDEIFLIGFSRGAYTARMVADFIGAIGVLEKKDMDHFAEIFLNYQMLGKADDEKERKEYTDKISRFTDHASRGKVNAEANRKFSIKCLAVFDTVGAIGLPGEFVMGAPKAQLFGFNDLRLGPHVERALHALALNERRKDFAPATWIQTDEGRTKGQVLHQCWFTGCHSDIGGGYAFHDLSDISMAWMVANLEDLIAVDMEYIKILFQGHHTNQYGEMLPHDSSTGVFTLADAQDRALPQTTNDTTHETIHPSALKCKFLRPGLAELTKANPGILWKVKPFEEQIQATWTFDPNHTPESEEGKKAAAEERVAQESYVKKSFIGSIKDKTGTFLRRASIVRKKEVTTTVTNGTVTNGKVTNGTVKRSSTVAKTTTVAKDGVAVKRASVQVVPEPTPPASRLSWFGTLLNDMGE